jgi:hypothetical protein
LPTAKSSSEGGGKEVSLAQLIAHEAALAGAIANLQMNENIQRPDGSPHGIPTGKMANLGSDVADQLAKALGPQAATHGGETAVREMMAEALRKTGTIGPYKVMRQFTDKLGWKFQAHHILEVKMFKKFNLGNAELGLP